MTDLKYSKFFLLFFHKTFLRFLTSTHNTTVKLLVNDTTGAYDMHYNNVSLHIQMSSDEFSPLESHSSSQARALLPFCLAFSLELNISHL